MPDVIIRPDRTVAPVWAVNDHELINNEIINPSTASDGLAIRAIRDQEINNSNTTQSYLLKNPTAVTAPVTAATLNLLGLYAGGPNQEFTVEIVVSGIVQSAITLIFDGFGNEWKTASWTSDIWTLASFTDCEVRLNAKTIGPDEELRFDEVYLAMSVTPTGLLSVSMSELRDLVAESSTFQAKVGAADDTAAKQKIQMAHYRQWADSDRPYAVVGIAPGFKSVPLAGGSQNWMTSEGMLWLYLTDYDRHPGNETDSAVDFYNFVGGVWNDIQVLAAKDDRLAANELTLESAQRTDPRREQRSKGWHEAELLVGWGR